MKEVISIYPHEILKPYIVSYNLRKITVQEAAKFPSNKQYVINFYIDGSQRFFNIQTQRIMNFSNKPILVGHQNKHNWDVIFDSHCEMISVQFTPTGMHYLFGMNMAETLNRPIELADITGISAKDAEEKIRNCKNNNDYKFILDNFFIKILAKRGVKQKSLLYHLNNFCNEPTSIESLAKNVSLSTRQLNRKFFEIVGTSPKAYQRKERFTRLLDQTVNSGKINWTSVTYEYDFFDQAHMIKDFKHFTSLAPSKYFKIYKPILNITY